ncbi:MAG: hypothetical protein MUF15_09130 [Acidobacteria bacterium]|jgi:hypothetical protein|nr:hypothetical protein [Acidobacteriota bacterium]
MSELNVQELVKKVDTQLRQSERQMFSGKKDEAVALYLEAAALFDQANQAEPANAQVKTLEQKLSKLKKDLEKRTGSPIGGGTPPAAEKPGPAATLSTPPAEPSKTGTPKDPTKATIPYNARKPMQDAQNQLRSLENNFKQLQDADPASSVSLVSRIENNLSYGRQMLKEAVDEASKTGAGNHPDLEKIAADFYEAESRLAQAKQKVAEQGAQSAAMTGEVNTDCDALKSEYERLRPVLDKCGIIYYNDLEPLKEQIAIIEEFERVELPGLKEKLTTFECKYGATRDEINKKADEAGYSGVTRAADGWTMLTEKSQAIMGTRVKMANDIIDRMEGQLSHLKNISDFHRLQQHTVIREWLAMAARYHNDSPKVKEMSCSLDSRLKEDIEHFNAVIDRRTWPGNSTGTTAEAALAYFEHSSGWFKPPHPGKVLGVAIHGDWSVQEWDILGNPIMYGIPVFVAVLMDEEKETGLARVYDLTLRTEQKKGVQSEPPFSSDTVGSSFYIRVDRIG